MTINYTKAEREAINRAFDAIEYAASMTNWSDKPRLFEAFKQERQQAAPDQEMPIVWAKGQVCKFFLKGFVHPDMPAHEIADSRLGALQAVLLGISIAKRAGNYPKELREAIQQAADLCSGAVEALEAQFERFLDRGD